MKNQSCYTKETYNRFKSTFIYDQLQMLIYHTKSLMLWLYDDIEQISNKAILGSVVVTNHLTVFISTALPKITIDYRVVFAISPQSPLGIQLMHKPVQTEFLVNQVNYKIIEIL